MGDEEERPPRIPPPRIQDANIDQMVEQQRAAMNFGMGGVFRADPGGPMARMNPLEAVRAQRRARAAQMAPAPPPVVPVQMAPVPPAAAARPPLLRFRQARNP